MVESLVGLAQAFRAALVSLQPELHSGEECAAVVEELALVEKLSAVTRMDAALRVKECGTHRERGFAHVTHASTQHRRDPPAEVGDGVELGTCTPTVG